MRSYAGSSRELCRGVRQTIFTASEFSKLVAASIALSSLRRYLDSALRLVAALPVGGGV
jgi:hypothetical protein